EVMTGAIGQVADPIIGQFGDVGVLERGAPFDFESEASEILGWHSDDGDVADNYHLHPCRPLLALDGCELAALVRKDFANAHGVLRRVGRGVTRDLLLFCGFVEGAYVEIEWTFECG